LTHLLYSQADRENQAEQLRERGPSSSKGDKKREKGSSSSKENETERGSNALKREKKRVGRPTLDSKKN
jgi:hypothetical protein